MLGRAHPPPYSPRPVRLAAPQLGPADFARHRDGGTRKPAGFLPNVVHGGKPRRDCNLVDIHCIGTGRRTDRLGEPCSGVGSAVRELWAMGKPPCDLRRPNGPGSGAIALIGLRHPPCETFSDGTHGGSAVLSDAVWRELSFLALSTKHSAEAIRKLALGEMRIARTSVGGLTDRG